jgi:hypothetical protein
MQAVFTTFPVKKPIWKIRGFSRSVYQNKISAEDSQGECGGHFKW